MKKVMVMMMIHPLNQITQIVRDPREGEENIRYNVIYIVFILLYIL